MSLTKEQLALKEALVGKLHRHFGRDVDNASRDLIFKACALLVRDRMAQAMFKPREVTEEQRLSRESEPSPKRHFDTQTPGQHGYPAVRPGALPGASEHEAHAARVHRDREVHYLSLEFLLGRSLMKNAFNLGLLDDLKAVLEDLNVRPDDIFEAEQDPGLGNGGLGRLAACYLDSLTTLGIPATGYSICYQYGVFKQKIVEGQQIELPDPWLDSGDAWLIAHTDETEEIRFGGTVELIEQDGRLVPEYRDYTAVLAVPMDMVISGFQTDHRNTLRLWDAKSPKQIDMSLFTRGEYLRAVEQNAMAEVIAKVLYPEDNHFEGKLLRLRQQYFFVSATIQSIVRRHKAEHGHLRDFHHHHVIQINDTHPALAIPELMRIFLDEEHMDWDDAFSIVSQCVAYTNHTVLSEAMECWSQGLIEMLLPRIWQILCAINDRYIADLKSHHYSFDQVRNMAIIWDGVVRMANLCVCACFAINGVSELHSKILKDEIFCDAYHLTPSKFYNVTNGVDHRRWLAQINPDLHGLISDLIGDSYLTRPYDLYRLERFTQDKSVLERLAQIKLKNKLQFANLVYHKTGIAVDPESIFDVHVKRLHEYKRQLLNVMHIISLYQTLHDNPQMPLVPHTFFFAAKAATGYHMAKRIIRLIASLADRINQDPFLDGRIRVVFLEDYRVSLAERLMPAAELSQQISTAGKEASGTGNMKFMLNGALTIGTLDGANVEMAQTVGDENIFIFGLRAEQIKRLRHDGNYQPLMLYNNSFDIKCVIDTIARGFDDGVTYEDIAQSLMLHDSYYLLSDFEDYCQEMWSVSQKYQDPLAWNRSSLINIARSGGFAADRSISQYAKYIWGV